MSFKAGAELRERTENMDYQHLDWNQIWRTHHARKMLHERRGPGHWDKRAKDFTRAVARGDYVEQFLDICRILPGETVLDVGAAAGTLAVPLASRAASVTALEPSKVMRELLAERCRDGGIGNVRIVNGRWEDDWPALDIEAHDVTIASRSLIVDDLAMAVDKLRRHTRRRAYITTLVGDGPFDRGLIAGAGREFTPGLDYIVVLNYLRQIGIFAQLTFTTHHEARIFPTLDEAVEGLSWMVHDITAEEKIRLREYLDGALVRENGMMRLPTRPVRWAVLWWDEEGPCGQGS